MHGRLHLLLGGTAKCTQEGRNPLSPRTPQAGPLLLVVRRVTVKTVILPSQERTEQEWAALGVNWGTRSWQHWVPKDPSARCQRGPLTPTSAQLCQLPASGHFPETRFLQLLPLDLLCPPPSPSLPFSQMF